MAGPRIRILRALKGALGDFNAGPKPDNFTAVIGRVPVDQAGYLLWLGVENTRAVPSPLGKQRWEARLVVRALAPEPDTEEGGDIADDSAKADETLEDALSAAARAMKGRWRDGIPELIDVQPEVADPEDQYDDTESTGVAAEARYTVLYETSS